MVGPRKHRRYGPRRLGRVIHPGVVLTLTTLVLIRTASAGPAAVTTRGLQGALVAALVPLTLQAMAGTRGMADRHLVQGLFAVGLALLVSVAVAGGPWRPTLQLSATVLGAGLILAGQYRSRRV